MREELDVETTPQTFIDGELVGTLDDLREYFGQDVPDPDATTYRPVVTLFAITCLMAIGAAHVVEGSWFSTRTVEWFVAFTMCGLGYLKVRDVEAFSLMFLNYDLLARRWVRYSTIYPYAETGAGLLMIPAVFNWVSVPVAAFIGTIGAVSVIKAVWIDKRELTCACVVVAARCRSGSPRSPRTSPWSPWRSGWEQPTSPERLRREPLTQSRRSRPPTDADHRPHRHEAIRSTRVAHWTALRRSRTPQGPGMA